MIRIAAAAASAGPLAIRPWTRDDAEAVHALVVGSADHLAPWMPWVGDWTAPDCDPRAVIEPLVAEWEARERYHGGIYLDGVLIGSVGIVDRVGPDALEVGYWLASAATGRGHATAATALAVDLAFTDPEVERVVIVHDEANARSRGVPERLGFADRGTAPERAGLGAPGGSGVDRTWELVRADWTGYASRA
ncbi:MAG: GNAT family N-acetyltransferase [Actinomycetota bacterium]